MVGQRYLDAPPSKSVSVVKTWRPLNAWGPMPVPSGPIGYSRPELFGKFQFKYDEGQKYVCVCRKRVNLRLRTRT